MPLIYAIFASNFVAEITERTEDVAFSCSDHYSKPRTVNSNKKYGRDTNSKCTQTV